MNRTFLFGVLGLAVVVVLGCTKTEPGPKKSPDPIVSADVKAKYLLASEPAGAKGVIDTRKQAKDNDEVVVVGRIGGSKEPFTGRAAFTIVDPSFVACTEREEPEESATPWEFC